MSRRFSSLTSSHAKRLRLWIPPSSELVLNYVNKLGEVKFLYCHYCHPMKFPCPTSASSTGSLLSETESASQSLRNQLTRELAATGIRFKNWWSCQTFSNTISALEVLWFCHDTAMFYSNKIWTGHLEPVNWVAWLNSFQPDSWREMVYMFMVTVHFNKINQ